MGDKPFGNLHGIESRPFADLVGNAPEGDAPGVCNILSDTPYIHGVLIRGQKGHRIAELFGIVHNNDALLCLKSTTRLLGSNCVLALYPYRLAVCSQYRNSHAGCTYCN